MSMVLHRSRFRPATAILIRHGWRVFVGSRWVLLGLFAFGFLAGGLLSMLPVVGPVLGMASVPVCSRSVYAGHAPGAARRSAQRAGVWSPSAHRQRGAIRNCSCTSASPCWRLLILLAPSASMANNNASPWS